jgi:hypothetical protein
MFTEFGIGGKLLDSDHLEDEAKMEKIVLNTGCLNRAGYLTHSWI